MARDPHLTMRLRPGGVLHAAEEERDAHGVTWVRPACGRLWHAERDVETFDYRHRENACRHPACRIAFRTLTESDLPPTKENH